MAAVRIENRSQLIYLLTEAAELEHEVLCCYLFASFSMKKNASEALSAEQVESVGRWNATIREIAVQEMVHLASACNLLTAVGGAPQLRKPNLPASPRAYPAAFKLRLVPFGREALEQFVFLERPQGLDGSEQQAPSYRDSPLSLGKLSDIFSSERKYGTLGELYRGIEDGLKYLTQKFGEERLFIGPATAQTADSFFGLPGLIPVRDLASALEAVRVIIEQGEGASAEVEDSHYKRFLRMREEYGAILATDASFEPGRPVLLNPYAIVPTDLSDSSELNLIDDPQSVDICNLFDGCYELMIQMLGRLFVHAEESEADLSNLADTAVGLMFEAVEALGEGLTELVAGPSHPGKRAGASFRLSRGATIPTHKDAARFIFHERLTELVSYCRFLQLQKGAPAVLGQVSDALSRFAASFVPERE